MISNQRRLTAILPVLMLLGSMAVAQWMERRSRGQPDRGDYPIWEIDPRFRHDVFTFARIQFDSGGYRSRGGNWRNDYPDCDWNFSFRLQQLTSLQVDPDGKVLRLSDPELFDYPLNNTPKGGPTHWVSTSSHTP